MLDKTVAVIGLGYIGLPTSVFIASRGFNVNGLDINQKLIEKIKLGETPFKEPGLDLLLSEVLKKGKLKVSSKIQESDIYILCVPTPFNKDEEIKNPDLNFVLEAIETISVILKKGDLLLIESTCPVGTTELIKDKISKSRKDLNFEDFENPDINIAYCPERVLPGNILEELDYNDRVIGGLTVSCANKAKEFYKSFISGSCFSTNSKTAEMVKLTENSSRDLQIAFANEISILADKLGVNVWELIDLSNKHPRVEILNPGPGVGGHCIAVDPWFLISQDYENSPLLYQARRTNKNKESWVVNKVLEQVKIFLKVFPKRKEEEVTIACFGLSYKANIGDLRESPALAITQRLSQHHKGRVIAVEPNVEELDAHYNFSLKDVEEAIKEADISVVLVNHEEFSLDSISGDFIVDTVGILNGRTR